MTRGEHIVLVGTSPKTKKNEIVLAKTKYYLALTKRRRDPQDLQK